MAVLQNKIAYVTGSSKGIGKALVKLLLDNDYKVIGFSRTNEIQDPNFEFRAIDLADLKAVQLIDFDISGDKVVLINNAGLIGEIGPVGSIPNDQIINVINVNTLAPQILTNKFINRFKNENNRYHILNISSGAASKPIDAWATYCASKAALDLFSETVAEELEWRQSSNWNIHACAPGVVDTNMQAQIRSSSKENFKLVENFKELKANNELLSTAAVAKKLFEVVQFPEKFEQTVISVRDF